MKKKLAILLLAVLFVGSQLQAQDVAKPALRTWKDSTGQFSIQAAFVRVNGDNVVLQGIDKKEISLPLAKLSATDQQYVKARLTPSNLEQSIAALEKLGGKRIKKDDDGNIVSVDLHFNQQVRDADLEHLKGMTKLVDLNLLLTTKITSIMSISNPFYISVFYDSLIKIF